MSQRAEKKKEKKERQRIGTAGTISVEMDLCSGGVYAGKLLERNMYVAYNIIPVVHVCKVRGTC